VPPNVPANYASDMPAFGGALTDEEIWAVLSFIASSWGEQAKAWQREIGARARR
jgi:mono/diheme cytochrome c family protein